MSDETTEMWRVEPEPLPDGKWTVTVHTSTKRVEVPGTFGSFFEARSRAWYVLYEQDQYRHWEGVRRREAGEVEAVPEPIEDELTVP